jgi:hypothetical protein
VKLIIVSTAGTVVSQMMVNEICGLLGYYAATCGNCLTMFRDNVSVPSSWVKSLTREDGTDTLSRNVGVQLPHDAA